MKAQIVQSKKPSLGKKIGWVVMLLMAAYIVYYASTYLTRYPEVQFTDQKMVYMAHHTILLVHIATSMLPLIIGPFQFLPGIRKRRWLKVHRWLGRIYLLSILFGGLSGLYMAQLAYGGAISHLGFSALAILWLYTGYRAYKHIRAKEIEQHRQWMIRNYALTFAAVMLRVWNPIFGMLGGDFTTGYIAIAWLCWVPNLLVAEWIIRRRRSQPHTRVVARLGNPVSGQETVQTDF